MMAKQPKKYVSPEQIEKGSMKELTKRLGEGNVQVADLPLLLERAKKTFLKVTPQFVSRYRHLSCNNQSVKAAFEKSMYECALEHLRATQTEFRFGELCQIVVTCGMSLGMDRDQIMKEIKTNSGKDYRPGQKKLNEFNAQAYSSGSALGAVWK